MILLLSLVFSSFSAQGTTLVETATATAVSNSLRQVAQPVNVQAIDQAKQASQQYQEAVNHSASQQVIIHDRHDPASPSKPWDVSKPLIEGENYIPGGQFYPAEQRPQNRAHQHPGEEDMIIQEMLARETLERHKREEYPKNFSDIPAKKIRINYKAKTLVFYKKECESSATNCVKSHPVLTNIKSVIFNHDREHKLSAQVTQPVAKQ